MAGGITIGGKLYGLGDFLTPETLPVPVLGVEDHGIQFRVGEGYNKRRTDDIDLVVHHWTGGEAEPERMAKYLKTRKLGVEFAISRQGVIFQFCDPLVVDTADAGSYNSRSVGIEMVNYGFRNPRDPKRWIIPRAGIDRAIYDTRMHGRKRKFASFYPWQLKAAFQLADVLSEALEIPRAVKISSVEIGEMLRDWSGHVGHYQINARKSDPGTLFMDELQDHFEGKA